MNSSSFPAKTPEHRETRSFFRKRLLPAALVCSIELLYLPTSNQVAGGIEPKLPIDIFPIWPVWVVPYVLCYLLWVGSFLWFTWKMNDQLFRAFIAACTLTFSIGVSTYIFFPTFVRAATLEGKDVFTVLLRFIHENWGRYDAFPSGHVYITTLIALFLNRWYPRWRYGWFAMVVIVAFSTLFTGQHYVIDPVGGYFAALAGYHFGLWWAGFYPARKAGAGQTVSRLPSSMD